MRPLALLTVAAALLVLALAFLGRPHHQLRYRTLDVATPVTGCAVPLTAGDHAGTFTWSGQVRPYLLRVPPMTTTAPLPLVVALPGYAMSITGATVASLPVDSHLSTAADTAGVLVAYLQGTPTSTGVNTWTPTLAMTGDVGAVAQMVTVAEGLACVDTTRIAVAGISAGGVMAYAVACSGQPWLASLLVVAATNPWPVGCHLAHATSLLAFHGTADPIVPYWLSNPPAVWRRWAQAQGCTGTTDVAVSATVTETMATCPAGVDVQGDTLVGVGHQWPGGGTFPFLGPNTQAVDAAALMMAFVQAHPWPPEQATATAGP